METEFTKEYFIKKFEAIPEDKWCVGELTAPNDKDCYCALGHCGVLETSSLNPEARGLKNLLWNLREKIDFIPSPEAGIVYQINDNEKQFGSTPRERILNALNMVSDDNV